MTATHTPGRWVIDIDPRKPSARRPVHTLMVVAERGGLPGLIINLPPVVAATDWANARLVAASPELLAALRDLLAIIEVDPRTKRGDYFHERKAAREAIARAETPTKFEPGEA